MKHRRARPSLPGMTRRLADLALKKAQRNSRGKRLARLILHFLQAAGRKFLLIVCVV